MTGGQVRAPRLLVAALISVLGPVAACTAAPGQTAPPPTAPPPTAPALTAPALTAPALTAPAAPGELAEAGPGARPGALADLRVERGTSEDQVVFEFAGELPGYRVLYATEPAFVDEKGTAVDVSSEVVLLVELSPGDVLSTWRGPDRLAAPASVGAVEDVARVRGPAGTAAWAVGLRERLPFTVTAASAPDRLVISLSHND